MMTPPPRSVQAVLMSVCLLLMCGCDSIWLYDYNAHDERLRSQESHLRSLRSQEAGLISDANDLKRFNSDQRSVNEGLLQQISGQQARIDEQNRVIRQGYSENRRLRDELSEVNQARATF